MRPKPAHLESRVTIGEPDTSFRQRSHEVSRIEAFSDVVFGFSLTLLVVSLEVPHTFKELLADMRGFVPFAMCFAIFAMVWWQHHNFFRRYGLDDGVTATLNFVLLFVMLFYTYPLKFLFTGMFSHILGSDTIASSGGKPVQWIEAAARLHADDHLWIGDMRRCIWFLFCSIAMRCGRNGTRVEPS